MIKFLLKLFVAICTFFIGICSSHISQFYLNSLPELRLFDEKAIYSQTTPIKTNLCRILDYPEIYDGKLVVFEANAFVLNDEVFLDYYVRCLLKEETISDHLKNNIFYQKLELQEYNGNNRNLNIFLEMFETKGLRTEVDVKIIGVPRRFINKNGNFEFYIVPINIELVSAFYEFLPRASG